MKKIINILDKLLVRNVDISLTGFIEDRELEIMENKGFGAYPAFVIQVRDRDKLKKVLKYQILQKQMYDLAIDQLIAYEESMDNFNEHLENDFSGSIHDFKETSKAWLKSIIINMHVTILQENKYEIMFYIH